MLLKYWTGRGQFCNLHCKGSPCFDFPDYWMSAICLAKLRKTAFCPRYVSFLKIHHLIVLFTSDVVYKKCKLLVYTSPNLLTRFCRVTLSNTKIHFGLSFRQRSTSGVRVTSSLPCWWTVNKRLLISSFCLSTSICSFHHCYLCLPRLHENHLQLVNYKV